jgi:hypothetical protein
MFYLLGVWYIPFDWEMYLSLVLHVLIFNRFIAHITGIIIVSYDRRPLFLAVGLFATYTD